MKVLEKLLWSAKPGTFSAASASEAAGGQISCCTFSPSCSSIVRSIYSTRRHHTR